MMSALLCRLPASVAAVIIVGGTLSGIALCGALEYAVITLLRGAL